MNVRRGMRRWQVVVLVVLVLACPLLGGAVAWQVWSYTAGSADRAADAIANAPAVRLDYVYSDASGKEISGTFTVTADGYVTGTVNDPGVGKAVFAETPDGSAVYGDEDWWLRRTPDRVGNVWGRWVQPGDGARFPVDVAKALSPSALAGLVRAVAERGQESDSGETLDGVPVVMVTSGDWTLAMTQEWPRRVVWLAGPVESSEMRPAIHAGNSARIVPVGLGGDRGAAIRPVDGPSDSGYMSIRPEPENSSGANEAKSKASDNLSGKSGPPPGMARPPGSPAAGDAAPPKSRELPAQRPKMDFTMTKPSGKCVTPICPFTVTVKNVGTVPGTAVVIAGAQPGMALRRDYLGILHPGETKPITYHVPNQSPGVPVDVNYLATVYCPEVDGDWETFQKLVNAGITPDSSPVGDVEQKYAPALNEAMAEMLRDKVDGATVKKAMTKAVREGLIREIVDFRAAGTRFVGWAALAKKLAQDTTKNPGAWRGYLREIRLAHRNLMEPARPEVSLDTPRLEGDRKKVSDVVVKSKSRSDCYQIKSFANAGMTAYLNDAIDQLSGNRRQGDIYQQALKNCQKLVYLYVESGPKSKHATKDKRALQDYFQRVQKGKVKICNDPSLKVDKIFIQTESGTYELTKSDLCG